MLRDYTAHQHSAKLEWIIVRALGARERGRTVGADATS
jgi:hypothetical protein